MYEIELNSFSFLILFDNIYVSIAISALLNAKNCILCSSYHKKTSATH